jgi:hypothetical protein
MMKKYLIATLVVAVLVMQANASMLSDSEGPGIAKCAAFNDLLRRTNPASVNMTFFSWSQGYMTAVNQAKEHAGIQRKNLGAASYEKKVQAIVSFCASNPNSSYMEGVQSLLSRLPDMEAGQ